MTAAAMHSPEAVLTAHVGAEAMLTQAGAVCMVQLDQPVPYLTYR